MDELERRMKDDAAGIRADVSPELAARIDVSLRAVLRAPSRRRPGRLRFSLWWISSLTGVAAALSALAVIAFVNRGAIEGTAIPVATPGVETMVESSGESAPPQVWQLDVAFPLRAETAVLTEPLEEEFEKLRSDIEKARDTLEEDLRLTF